MAIKNNYWKILSKQERFYTAWPGGWEIRVIEDTYGVWNNETQKCDQKTIMRQQIPSGCPKATRANFKRKFAMDKRIAQSVSTKEQYNELWSRIDEGDWDFIEKNDLKDGDLVHWAYNTHTADEFYKLLRFN